MALLERASVFVHLDPRGAGVVVPVHFKKQPRLVLQIGLNMAVPITDLRVDEQGLSCTLSFNRSLFHCVVPWSGIFALVGEDGRGMVWPDDVPAEIAREMAPAPGEKDDSAAPPSTPGVPTDAGGASAPRKRPQMSLVGSTSSRSTGGASAEPGKNPSKRAPGGAKRKGEAADKPTLFKLAPPDKNGKGKPSKLVRTSQPARDAQRPKGSAPFGAPLDLAGKPRADGADRGTKSVEPGASKNPGVSAVPPAAPSSPAGASTPSASPSAPSRTPSSNPPSGGHGHGRRSPKKELPPYLRVVK